VSTYNSTCSGASDPNYNISYVGGHVSVGPRNLSVTPDAQVITAGEPVPGESFYAFTFGGFYNVDPPVTLPTCGSSYDGTENSGTVLTITCSGGSGGSNYNTPSYSTSTLTVQ
jgi:hypothetical protein